MMRHGYWGSPVKDRRDGCLLPSQQHAFLQWRRGLKVEEDRRQPEQVRAMSATKPARQTNSIATVFVTSRAVTTADADVEYDDNEWPSTDDDDGDDDDDHDGAEDDEEDNRKEVNKYVYDEYDDDDDDDDSKSWPMVPCRFVLLARGGFCLQLKALPSPPLPFQLSHDKLQISGSRVFLICPKLALSARTVR